MIRGYGDVRRACLRACPTLNSGLQSSFPALAARYSSEDSTSSCKGGDSFRDTCREDCAAISSEAAASDAAVSRSGLSWTCSQYAPSSENVHSSQQACKPSLWTSAGRLIDTGQQSCRSFSAQPLPANGPEPLGFVKGGYSVEQFPPDKACLCGCSRPKLLRSSWCLPHTCPSPCLKDD